ncbi:MAG TPA: hypothetical protein VM755_22625 [Stellaceae bacterium]|nr:hypothetical protein [Stellaceae bacterium]
MSKIPRAIAFAAALSLAACAGAAVSSTAPSIRRTALGPVFADAKGMTLYTYDGDRPGLSKCDGLCAIAWPPAGAAADARPAGRFTLITRADGSRQWAYKGAPLYGYFRDSKPGDTAGDGDDGVWRVAKP